MSDPLHVAFNDATGAVTGCGVRNVSGAANAYSGMLFYDQNGALGHFQGFNNATREYRLNNVAPGGSLNFMVAGKSRFAIRNNGDLVLGGPVYFGTADSRFLHTGAPVAYYSNTFVGTAAGNVAVTGGGNVGIGGGAMHYTTSGLENVAVGGRSLASNTTGNNNVAIGTLAMGGSVNGVRNTAVGDNALNGYFGFDNTGGNNTALGADAGAWVGSGSNNINIGAGVKGDSQDANTMYLRNVGTQVRTFIAGVRGITTANANAIPVVIDSAGQLGTISSSRRFKDDIADMGTASQRVLNLRPVTFHYRQAAADGSRPVQFGLVVEEVADAFPELAVRDANGDVETVHYETLNVLLLNELQRLMKRVKVLEQLLHNSGRNPNGQNRR